MDTINEEAGEIRRDDIDSPTDLCSLGMKRHESRSIVQSHQRELTVTPNLPHGATFSIGLPAVS